jgi:hypothetical protein
MRQQATVSGGLPDESGVPFRLILILVSLSVSPFPLSRFSPFPILTFAIWLFLTIPKHSQPFPTIPQVKSIFSFPPSPTHSGKFSLTLRSLLAASSANSARSPSNQHDLARQICFRAQDQVLSVPADRRSAPSRRDKPLRRITRRRSPPPAERLEQCRKTQPGRRSSFRLKRPDAG